MTPPRVAIVDYGIGNLHSALKALRLAGARAELTADSVQIAAADAVVLPGVGAFGACMQALRDHDLDQPVLDAVASGRPFLGICVGMQMLFDDSVESPGVPGLGVIPGSIVAIPAGVKRPQMQWNQLDLVPGADGAVDPLFAGLGERPWLYFVHSFVAAPADPADVIATCEYGGSLAVAFRRGNVAALQFHPEKSADSGLRLLGNFVAGVTTAVEGAA